MRDLFAGLQPHHRPGTYECIVDQRGLRHVTRADELELHITATRCVCNPTVKNAVADDGYRCLVVIHRRLRNSRALYQPWQDGH